MSAFAAMDEEGHELDSDPYVKALERSTIAQTLKEARASLAEPSRPFTPLDRSLFQVRSADDSRPSSSYGVDQLSFVRDTYGRPGSSQSREPRVPETISENGEEEADLLWLDGEGEKRLMYQSDVGNSDDESSVGSEELVQVEPPTESSSPHPPPTPPRIPTRPPKPPSNSNTAGGIATALRSSPGHYDVSSRSDASPRFRKASASPSHRVVSGFTPPASPRHDWDADCAAVIVKLQKFAESAVGRESCGDVPVKMSQRISDIVEDLKVGKSKRVGEHSSKLLHAVLSLLDLKDVRCLFKLARCALALLPMQGAVQSAQSLGAQAAYLNIAKVLFKLSKTEGHDNDFFKEGLITPLLEVLQSKSPECQSDDLRVYIAGVFKNVSSESANQRHLAELGVGDVLFMFMTTDMLTGSSREAQLLIQITATLRNLACHKYKYFLREGKLNTLTSILALFPSQIELLTNVSRILAKLTVHEAACEALAGSDAHIRQYARTLSANTHAAPLVLRFAFVLGNLTTKSDRMRVVYAFNCEGIALSAKLLSIYWQKDKEARQLGNQSRETEEVLVKLVRLVANIAISTSIGATITCSSAVIDPLLDLLGAKRISDSEELVLNVVAAITNLLFYDVPTNLLFEEDNKLLLCRLFRPLLLDSYNIEALIETARALGNLGRHSDARQHMTNLRLDEILVILLDHENRELVYYVSGAIVNLAADAECTSRLAATCPEKLAKLLHDAPADDYALQLVAVKVLTNLSIDPSAPWSLPETEAALLQLVSSEGTDSTDRKSVV